MEPIAARPVKPTNAQLASIQAALLEAFDPDELRQMLRTRLDTNILRIVSDKANQDVQIEAVVAYFASQKNGLHRLIEGASQSNQDSVPLKEVCAELGSTKFAPLPRHISWYASALVAASIMVAIAFAVVTFNALLPPPEAPPVIAPTATPITRMTGGLNIAIAQFGVLNNDKAGAESEPNGLADEIFDSLQVELTPLIQDSRIEVQWLGPEEVGVIQGDSADERAENAEEEAALHRADLLIYGYVSSDDVQSVVEPLLFVSSERLLGAQEMAGLYSMGGEMEMQGDIEHNTAVSTEARSRMALRAGSLAQFAMGLGYFATGRYDKAVPFFVEANRQALAAEQDGREAILLFLGNTAGRLNDLPLAGHFYAEALEENNGYARAQLGVAQVEFQLAKDECEPGKANIDGIERAIDGFDAARDALDQPASAEIQTKAAFFKGGAYFCLANAQGSADFSDAKTQMTRVTEQYAATQNHRIRYLAADAHSVLGRIAVREADAMADDASKLALWQEAEGNYRRATELTQDLDRKANYSLWLAQLLIWQGRMDESTFCPEAQTLFADAERYAAQFQAENPSAVTNDYAALHDTMEQRLAAACPSTPAP